MADWATIATAATAVGTLVLAVATFSSTRSANMAARVAERSLQVGLRPLLMPSRFEDPLVKVNFIDEHLVPLRGGMGVVEEGDGNLYMVMGLQTRAPVWPFSTAGSCPRNPRIAPSGPSIWRRPNPTSSVG